MIHGILILAVGDTTKFYNGLILSHRVISDDYDITNDDVDNIIFSDDISDLMDTSKGLPVASGVHRVEVDIYENYYPPTLEEPEDFDYTFHVTSSKCLVTTQELFNELKITRPGKKRARTFKSSNRKWKVRKRRN